MVNKSLIMYNKFPHYYQINQKDCAPTCLRIISKYFGRSFDPLYLRELCKADRKGTIIINLSETASAIGLRNIVFEISFDSFIEKSTLPCICHLNPNHYVVVYKITSKKIWVSDPTVGKIKYSHNEFKQIFLTQETQTGIIMFFEPQPLFYNIKSPQSKDEETISYAHIITKYILQYKPQLFQLGMIMLLITLLQGITPFIFRSLLDVGVENADTHFIDIMFIANLILIFSLSFSNFIKEWIIKHVSTRFGMSIISSYLGNLLDMPLNYFNSHSIGDILNRVKDHEKTKEFVLNNAINLIYSVISFVVFSFILYSFHEKLFFIFGSGTSLFIIWVLLFIRTQEKFDSNYNSLNSQNQNFWVETLSSITDIKVCNYEQKRRWKWEKIQVGLYQLNLRTLRINSVQTIGAQLINGTKNIFITFFSAKAVVNGEMTIGMMISIQFIIGFLNTPIQQFIYFIQTYSSAKTSFIRLNEIYRLEYRENKMMNEIYIEIPKEKTITLKMVYFKYPNNTFYTLKNISAIIPFGKVTAIVGKSGSGKSSLIKMLLRLHEITDGNIEVGNIQYKDISIKRWRDCCAAVLQETRIFNDTVLNNIIMDDNDIDHNRIEQISHIVNLKEVISELPNGYNSFIGEKGRLLSQGQKQRILIARALYRNPDFLFLDEATNSLDQYSEMSIINNIVQYMEGKTVIIATHKLNTITNANQILVFNNGKIIEQGEHQSLLKQKGYYYFLINFQQNIEQNILSQDV